ncbi:hypothetical protein J31TS4_36530 [Paenibacillus sp. J31TS4]|nr:hypothetical protein J31TS4_36530 [Paenibacillus sp. J31TS4]
MEAGGHEKTAPSGAGPWRQSLTQLRAKQDKAVGSEDRLLWDLPAFHFQSG